MRVVIHLQSPLKSNGNLERYLSNCWAEIPFYVCFDLVESLTNTWCFGNVSNANSWYKKLQCIKVKYNTALNQIFKERNGPNFFGFYIGGSAFQSGLLLAKIFVCI